MAPLRVIVKVAVPAPSLTVTSLMAKLGAASSSRMVPVAVAVVAVSATPLVVALVMVATTVSLASDTVSAVGSTVKVALVAPAAMVTVPVLVVV